MVEPIGGGWPWASDTERAFVRGRLSSLVSGTMVTQWSFSALTWSDWAAAYFLSKRICGSVDEMLVDSPL
jgi:hypothetical protein